MPLDWAATQNDLGNVLSNLGKSESGTARLEEAVAAYRAALQEYTRERVPLKWAMTQTNLGTALWTLAEWAGDQATLAEALSAVDAALPVMREAGADYYVDQAETVREGILAAMDRL